MNGLIMTRVENKHHGCNGLKKELYKATSKMKFMEKVKMVSQKFI